MVNECAYIYEDGRHCHRIPARGEKRCPGHLRPARRRRVEEELAFEQEIAAWEDDLRSLTFLDLLGTLGEALTAIRPVIDSRAPRSGRVNLVLASRAVAVTLDHLEQAIAQYSALSSMEAVPAGSEPAE